jgi:hypothetical protein
MKISVDKKGKTKAAADMKLALFSRYVRGQVNVLKLNDNYY